MGRRGLPLSIERFIRPPFSRHRVWPMLAVVVAATAGVQAKVIYWDTASGANSSNSTGVWDASGHAVWTADSTGVASRSTFSALGGNVFNGPNGAPTVEVSFAAGTNSQEIGNNVQLSATQAVLGMTVKDGFLNMTNAGNGALRIFNQGITIGTASNGKATGNTSLMSDSTIASTINLYASESQTWTNNAATNFTIYANVKNYTGVSTTLSLNAGATGNINLIGPVADNSTGSLAVTVNSAGSGSTVFNNANSYSGGTTLTSGSVIAQNSNAFGAASSGLTIASATLDLQSDSSIAAYNTIVTGNATFTSDVLTAGAGINHTLGTLLLRTGASKVTVTAGSNVKSGTASLTFGTTILADPITFDVENSSTASTVLTLGLTAQTISGTSLTKTGAGTLVLTGSNNYSGKTNIVAGTLALAAGARLNSGVGSVVMAASAPSGATFDVSAATNPTISSLSGIGTVKLNAGELLSLASAGSLNAAGALDQLVFTGGGTTGGLMLGANTTFEINTLANGSSQFDSVSLAGQKLYYNNSTLNLIFSGSPTNDSQFKLFDFGSSTGAPAQVNISGLTGITTASYDSSTGIVTVTVPEPTGLLLLATAVPLLRRKRKNP